MLLKIHAFLITCIDNFNVPFTFQNMENIVVVSTAFVL